MPIYEYHCLRCQSNFEELVLSTGETITCRDCSSPEVERLLSVFSAPVDRSGGAPMSGGCGGCGPGGCGCH
ncbi:MAG: zinc ribbon domain-containing protein [Deltaproteobacteria bacterium]|nr:zinc ribbon domain-containing protein [Deltaproteobacteria bacterium]